MSMVTEYNYHGCIIITRLERKGSPWGWASGNLHLWRPMSHGRRRCFLDFSRRAYARILFFSGKFTSRDEILESHNLIVLLSCPSNCPRNFSSLQDWTKPSFSSTVTQIKRFKLKEKAHLLNALKVICYPFTSYFCHLGQVILSRQKWVWVELDSCIFVP